MATSAEKSSLEVLRGAYQAILAILERLEMHGQWLISEGETKGTQVARITEELTKIVKNVDNNSKDHKADWPQFKEDMMRQMQDYEQQLTTHRERWKPLLINTFLMLTAIGALIIAARALQKALSHQPIQFNRIGFFAKTTSEKYIDTLRVQLEQTDLLITTNSK